MTSAIVDVGHIVTAQALAAGKLELALYASRVAYTAAPYDEVAQLDMIQAEKAVGDDDEAEQDLSDKIFNRRDDELPPITLPQRTAQIGHAKNWGSHRSRRGTTDRPLNVAASRYKWVSLPASLPGVVTSFGGGDQGCAVSRLLGR